MLQHLAIDTCPICYEPFDPGRDHHAVYLQGHHRCVDHVFGLRCIFRWFSEKRKCPLCRSLHIRSPNGDDSSLSEAEKEDLREQWREMVLVERSVPRVLDSMITGTLGGEYMILSINDRLTKRAIEAFLKRIWGILWKWYWAIEPHGMADVETVLPEDVCVLSLLKELHLHKEEAADIAAVCTLMLAKQKKLIAAGHRTLMPLPRMPASSLAVYRQVFEDAIY